MVYLSFIFFYSFSSLLIVLSSILCPYFWFSPFYILLSCLVFHRGYSFHLRLWVFFALLSCVFCLFFPCSFFGCWFPLGSFFSWSLALFCSPFSLVFGSAHLGVFFCELLIRVISFRFPSFCLFVPL